MARENWVEKDYPLVLWLVPTTTIRKQTIEALKNPLHPYRAALDEAFAGRVRVLDIGDFTQLTPHDIAANCCVVCCRMRDGVSTYCCADAVSAPHYQTGNADNYANAADCSENAADAAACCAVTADCCPVAADCCAGATDCCAGAADCCASAADCCADAVGAPHCRVGEADITPMPPTAARMKSMLPTAAPVLPTSAPLPPTAVPLPPSAALLSPTAALLPLWLYRATDWGDAREMKCK